jgi:hypothetical protein
MPEIKLKKYQDGFIFTEARFPALISAIGTGKTLCGISRMMDLMETYPDNLGIVVRKEFTDLKDSTIKDFELYTGLTVGSNKDCRLPNGSLIMFRHGDEINVLKNINAGAILIEQAEEFDSDETFTFLRDRLRRKQAKVRSLFIIANANGHNWIYNQWVAPQTDKEFECYQATTFDNADNLPADYIADLKKMELTHPEHYRRYVLNSHDDVDTVDQILKQEWISASLNKVVKYDPKSIVICDPARYGDDEHVIYAFQGNKIIDSDIYTNKSTMETAGRMLLMAKKHGIRSLGLDVIGVGAGIADRLKELGHKIIEINSACASSEPEKYKNLRAEMWAKAAEKFENNLVSILDDTMLKEELAQMRYKTIESSGKLQVEAKEDYKKRMARSPNRADAVIMGLWAVDTAQNIQINSGIKGVPYKAKHTY